MVMIIKCKNCGKSKGDHKAETLNCPIGRKHRVLGYTSFSEKTFWEIESDYVCGDCPGPDCTTGCPLKGEI